LVFFMVLALLANTLLVSSLTFELLLDQEKCFREELVQDVVVHGEYLMQPSSNTYTTIRVNDANGNEVWRKEGASDGTFAFTTEASGEIFVCFLDRVKPNLDLSNRNHIREATFKLKTGVQAKDYSSVAKKDDLKPIELEMLKLEDLLEEINNDMKYLRNREHVMRDTNESTNTRVLWLSITSLLVLLGLGIFQILYLKRYFRQKKIIR